jgi:uncharacterized membrane protein YphA (DoxX/SURF4 family)
MPIVEEPPVAAVPQDDPVEDQVEDTVSAPMPVFDDLLDEPLVPSVLDTPIEADLPPMAPPQQDTVISAPAPMGAAVVGFDGQHLPPPIDDMPVVSAPTPLTPPDIFSEGKPEAPPAIIEDLPATPLPEGTVDLTGEQAIPAVWMEDSVPDTSPLREDTRSAGDPVSEPLEEDLPAPTSVILSPEEERHLARAKALGEVDRGADVVIAPATFAIPSTYRPWPSFVLVLIRFIVAAILILRATRQLQDLEHTAAIWKNSLLPAGDMLAIATIGAQYLIALLLIVGLAVRGAGVAMMALFVVILCFLVWGVSPLFTDGDPGFLGLSEVLFVTLGLLFAGLGGGSLGIDGAVHRARLERKNSQVVMDA